MDAGILAQIEQVLPELRGMVSEALGLKAGSEEWHAAVERVQSWIDRIGQHLLREITKCEKDPVVRGEVALGLIRYADRDDQLEIDEKILTMRWLSQDKSFHSLVNGYAAEALGRLEARHRPWERVFRDKDAPYADKVDAGMKCIAHSYRTEKVKVLYQLAMDPSLPMEARVEATRKFQFLVAAGHTGGEDPLEIMRMAANPNLPGAGPRGRQITLRMDVGGIGTPAGCCEFIKRVAENRRADEEAGRTGKFVVPGIRRKQNGK
jgi:hypothetical protein